MKILIILLLMFSKTVLSAEFNVDSSPQGATIYAENTISGRSVKIGETPYEGNLETVAKNITDGKTFMVRIHKEGFEPFRVLIASNGNDDLKLAAKLDVSKNIELTQDLDLFIGELFDVQRQIRVKDYVSAHGKLEALEKKFPHYSVVHEMKGAVFYLQKEFKRSLSAYRKSFSLNSKNYDAYRMKNYLEKKFNVSKE